MILQRKTGSFLAPLVLLSFRRFGASLCLVGGEERAPPPRMAESASPVGRRAAEQEAPPRHSHQSVNHRSVASPPVDSPISTANAELRLVSRAHCHWWVIDPRKVRWIAHWDLAMTVALVYVAIVTPVEVAFVKPLTTLVSKASSPIFLINRLLDAMFILDILLNFRLAYNEE